jgi:hypothetical protein
MILFGGKVKSLGKNTRVSGINEKEVKELKEKLRKYGVKADAASFRKITPKKERPFYG